MINAGLVRAFMNAGKALATGAKDTGFTSNGLRKLDFKVDDKVFTALEQNPNKLSTPGKLARDGHQIILIRDDQQQALAGFVDVTENRFNSFENIPNVVDIGEIEQSLGQDVIKGDVPVSAARTAIPTGSPQDQQTNQAGQGQSGQSPQQGRNARPFAIEPQDRGQDIRQPGGVPIEEAVRMSDQSSQPQRPQGPSNVVEYDGNTGQLLDRGQGGNDQGNKAA